MPRLGETVDEVTILGWLVNDGDQVAVGDPLVRVETDKVEVDVPSPLAGVVISRNAEVGDTMTTGSVVCLIEPVDQSSHG